MCSETHAFNQQLTEIFAYISDHSDEFVCRLSEAVAIESVSCQYETRQQTIEVVKWFSNLLEKEGVKCELVEIGSETFSNGLVAPLPPILMAELGDNPNKKTICIYGHLDVQPADKSDGWLTEPFVLTEIDGKLYGRGATDDKGPVLGWLHAIQAFNRLNIEIPVNLKFIFEGMEESGSIGLNDVVVSRAHTFLKNVDYFCISDNYWLGTTKPCLTYGLRGQTYFYIEIECAAKDLHSGVYGGSVHEAMTDLIVLMSKLVDSRGNILIPGVYDDVLPMTEQEEDIYHQIEFDCNQYRDEVGTRSLIYENKINTLTHRWRFPSLSIHGIEGAFAGSGAKTVIPRKVIGKFSIRLVPDQLPEKVAKLVIDFVTEQFNKLNSANTMNIFLKKSCKPWIADPNDDNFSAGRLAMKTVYGVEPDLTREGGSIPVTLTLQEATGKSVMLLPMGAADDGAHSQNEKIDKRNYIEGTKVFASYLYHISLNT